MDNIYNDILAEMTNDGLSTKEWNGVLERYLVNKTLAVEEYEKMNTKQRDFIQELKRAYARISRKN